ncbi:MULTISPECIES: STAS domain-containing protein [unclassified Streptomyces]|uniref:STAS domain-containing protein n=1 Tax=unclassified Streptomyces TaxID=2593676 RepID=UPI002886F295|nr:STAS domain-containing protein [Streptomyces sp. DSM 41633]
MSDDARIRRASEFRTEMCATQGEAVVTVTGEIDLMTSPILRAALEEAMADRPHHLEVDFAHVTFCDCAGLTALLRARAAARQAGASFTLVHVDAPTVIRLFDLTEAGPLFGLKLAAA